MTVNHVRYMPEEQLVHRALEALTAVLGPIETMRFLTLPREKQLDAVEYHRQWQSSLERDTFFDEVFGKAVQSRQ